LDVRTGRAGPGAAIGLWQRHGGTTLFIPFASSTRETLQNIRHEARAAGSPIAA